MRCHRAWSVSLVILMVAGCGGSEAGEGHAEEMEVTRAVTILSPADGAELEGEVLIQLGAEGLEIVPAGIEQEHSGHHHLFIDRDILPVGEPMPVEEGIVHLGAAQTEHLLEGLAPGEHTVIAVLGDFQHVRLGDVPPDTVRFTVR